VLDTEAFIHTGGQKGKFTPAGSVAHLLRVQGAPEDNLGEVCMSYGNVSGVSVAMGAGLIQTIMAIAETGKQVGPSLILACAPCIEFKVAHYDGLVGMKKGMSACSSTRR